jgi:hypothetical protein
MQDADCIRIEDTKQDTMGVPAAAVEELADLNVGESRVLGSQGTSSGEFRERFVSREKPTIPASGLLGRAPEKPEECRVGFRIRSVRHLNRELEQQPPRYLHPLPLPFPEVAQRRPQAVRS